MVDKIKHIFLVLILPTKSVLASTVLFPIKKILNIDKYFVCESRDMSDESGTYIVYNSFKIKNYFVHLEIA
jgi:hypothetical protein